MIFLTSANPSPFTPGPSPQIEEHVLESRFHCMLADGWQPVPLLGSSSQTRSLYLCTSLSRRRVFALPQLPHPADVFAMPSDVSSRHRGGQMDCFPPPTTLSWSVWEVQQCWEIAMSQRLHMLSHCREVPERRRGITSLIGGCKCPRKKICLRNIPVNETR